MNEIKIMIEGLQELTDAIKMLAGVTGGQTANTATSAPYLPTAQQNLVQQGSIPVSMPQNYGQAPTQPALPVQQPAGAAGPMTNVPTTATTQSYTLEQLQVAAAGLSSMGKMPKVMAILQQFGIVAMTELPKERYGEFAIALREAGAQI